jgi:hypothetical protein
MNNSNFKFKDWDCDQDLNDNEYILTYYYDQEDSVYSVRTKMFIVTDEEMDERCKDSTEDLTTMGLEHIDWITKTYLSKNVVEINGHKYKYDTFYKKLNLIKGSGKVPHVACPNCHSTKISIEYNSYNILANCDCGHILQLS